MAQGAPAIESEDVPLDEARRRSRGPRMNPELFHALKEKLQSLDNTATRMPLPEGTSPTTMKNRILRVAAELGISVTIRSVPGGLIFWRSTDEDRRRPKRSPHDCRPLGNHHKQSGAAAACMYRAAHQHTTVTQREAIT